MSILAAVFAITTSTLSAYDDSPGRIVIDASKDGGVWWFPQGENGFDPTKLHQGNQFADYLKSTGWQVEEIARGADITDRLKGATIVVRASLFGEYRASEVRAYRDYVTNGGSVLLLRGFVRDGRGNSDAVATAFGIKFSSTVRARFITRWAKHPLVENLDLLPYNIGSVVTQSPEGSVHLAYLNDDRPVMGLLSLGEGKVIYLSTILPLLNVPQPFTERVIQELAGPRQGNPLHEMLEFFRKQFTVE
jgi:hypothetical protein